MATTQNKIREFFDGYTSARVRTFLANPPLSQHFRELFDGLSSARNRENSRTARLISNIESFIDRYVVIRSELDDQITAKVKTFAELVKGFTGVRDRSIIEAKATALEQKEQFQDLLQSYEAALAAWEKTQQSKADRFHILEVMDLILNEECHSRMLAWLLDRNYRKLGTHAQGSLGFRLFLEALSFPTVLADEAYVVRREISGDESRIDIEVAARGRFLMHIEVKIGAQEGYNQTKREWEDLRKRASEFNVFEGETGGVIIALFVTPSGRKPTDSHFKAVSWRKVAEVLEHFGGEAHAEDVKLFARHYAYTLRTFILAAEEEEKEDTDAGT
jgi:hypothetical protein